MIRVTLTSIDRIDVVDALNHQTKVRVDRNRANILATKIKVLTEFFGQNTVTIDLPKHSVELILRSMESMAKSDQAEAKVLAPLIARLTDLTKGGE